MSRALIGDNAHTEVTCGLEELVREGARRMLVPAIEAEVDGCVAFVDEFENVPTGW